MLESVPISGEKRSVFTEIVNELRRRALDGVGLLDLIAYTARELGGPNPDLESVVRIGPDGTSSVLRLALILYLNDAFGVVSGGVSPAKGVVWCLEPDGDTYTTTNTNDALTVSNLIENNRELWCDKLGD